MQDKTFLPFTTEMKKDYTILIPNMLPMHFKLIVSVFKTYGYNAVLLETSGEEIIDTGLKYTHNDACYPAILVIGQFLHALRSGDYDPDKTALIMFQTGGGCRASNYISLIRKALKQAGLPQVPVISFSLAGIEKHPGFSLTLRLLQRMMYAILYGDLLMTLVNQVKPYELKKGAADDLSAKWTKQLGKELGAGEKISYKNVKKTYKQIIRDFVNIHKQHRPTIKVGIVGEIFVKYSPLGNNQLEQFLVDEGAEVVIPGLIDFCLFVVYNNLNDFQLYRRGAALYPLYRIAYRFLCKKREDMSRLITQNSSFNGFTPFDRIAEMTEGYISTGMKMGEGWLLTAEMLELADAGCKNIVCTQPFGCLPNHICGKGMIQKIKEKNPHVNIVSIDYDPGASRVNQENRLKLMLFNAHRNAESSKDTPNLSPISSKEQLLEQMPS